MAINRSILGAAVAAAVVLTAPGLVSAHGPQGYGASQGHRMMPHHGQGMGMGHGMGHCMMGHGMMGQGMGHGMMGQGMGHGMMGQGTGPGMMGQDKGPGMMGYGMGRGMMGQGMAPGMMQPLARDLSADEVRHMMEHRLAWHGNPNVKVGKVEETDDDTIVAEIVTQDGSLVQRLEVDRHSGRMRPSQ